MDLNILLLIGTAAVLLMIEYTLFVILRLNERGTARLEAKLNQMVLGVVSGDKSLAANRHGVDHLARSVKRRPARLDALCGAIISNVPKPGELSDQMYDSLIMRTGLHRYLLSQLGDRRPENAALACQRVYELSIRPDEKLSAKLMRNALSADGQVQYWALMALSRLGITRQLVNLLTAHADAIHISGRYIQEILLCYTNDPFDLYQDLLRNGDNYIRSLCVKTLTQIEDRRFKDQYLSLIKNRDVNLRIACISAVAMLGDPEYDTRILPLLDDPYWEIRAMAAKCLGEIGTERCFAKLEDSINDPEWLVRVQSAYALTKHPGGIERVKSIIETGVDRYAQDALESALRRLDLQSA